MIRQLIAVVIALTSVNAFSKERYPWAHYDLNFQIGRTAAQSHLGMCDDSYYPGFTVSVPGRQGVEFKVTAMQLGRSCTLEGSRQEDVKGQIRTIYFINGSCDGEIDFESLKAKAKASLEIGEAC